MTNTPAVDKPMSGPTRGQKIALAFTMFLITGVFGFLQPFTPLYLEASGLTNFDIGKVSALGTIAALLFQPILGHLSDRFDTRRPFMIFAALCAAVAYSSFHLANGFVPFVLLTALGVNGFQYLNSVGGVLIGRMARLIPGAGGARGGGTAYVRYRIWGSVGYIVVALTTGILIRASLPHNAALSRTDLAPIFTYGPLLFVLIAIAACFVPDIRNAPTVISDVPAPTPVKRSPDARANLLWFLTTCFLYQFALYGASAYLALYMKHLGADSLMITLTFAGGVVVEVLMMTRIGKWVDTYGRRPALAATLLLLPLRLLLYIPATGPVWVMAVQTLHGVNFGIMGTISVVFINDLSADHERGAMQARLAVVNGIGAATGPLACGYLADKFGIATMFAAMSAVSVVAAVLFLLKVRESHPLPASLKRIPLLS